MPFYKIPDVLNYPHGHIFHQIVSGVVEKVMFGMGQSSPPLIEIIDVKNKIVPTPQNYRW